MKATTAQVQIIKKLSLIENRMRMLEAEVKGLMDAEYPSEGKIKKSLMKKIEAAEKRIKAGKGVRYGSFSEFARDVS